LHQRPPDPELKEIMKGGGRGYYRPSTLLSLWTQAPFMHNNAIGPEVCGKPSRAEIDFYSAPYTDQSDRPLANPPPCLPFDPSVAGRYQLYKDSMQELLNPSRRLRKVTLTDEDIVIDVAPNFKIGPFEGGLSIRLPKGKPAILINSLRYKDLLQDIVLSRLDQNKFDDKYRGILTAERSRELRDNLRNLDLDIGQSQGRFTIDISDSTRAFIQAYYSNVLGRVENAGHTFGQDLPEREKRALIAFLATL
jgi:hypothetical protein